MATAANNTIPLAPMQQGAHYPQATHPAHNGMAYQQGGMRPITPLSPSTQTWAPPYPPPDMGNRTSQGPYVPPTPPIDKLGLSQDDVDERPWKYCGYRGFSAWLASSDDAVVLRRFNRLHARVLLHMQYKITCQEEYLEALDMQHIRRPEEMENNSFYDHDVRRTNVLNDLQGLLKEYDDLIISHRELRSNPEAEGYQIRNLKNFFDIDRNADGPIAPKETEFINEDGDLVALVQKSKTLLRRGLDKLESWRTFFIFKERTEKAHHYQKWYTSKITTYYDEVKMDRYLNIIITVIGIGVILGPLWLLKEQSAETSRLITISVSLAIFTILLNILTVARTFDSLAAAAAYAAVLMVFMQLGPNSALANATSNGTSKQVIANDTWYLKGVDMLRSI